MESFSSGLRKLRIKNNLTQEQIANLLFMSKSNYCMIENGKTSFPSDRIPILCKILLCEPNDIFNSSLDYENII